NNFPAKRHRNSKRNRTAARHAKKFHGTRCQAGEPEFVERYDEIGKAYRSRSFAAKPLSAMWQIGHTAGQSRPLPKRCPSRGAITTLDVVWELFGSCLGVVCELFGSCSGGASGGAMSDDPSPTTYRFNVGNNRRVRLRIDTAAMRAGIVVL